jgi:hypothetical protein
MEGKCRRSPGEFPVISRWSLGTVLIVLANRVGQRRTSLLIVPLSRFGPQLPYLWSTRELRTTRLCYIQALMLWSSYGRFPWTIGRPSHLRIDDYLYRVRYILTRFDSRLVCDNHLHVPVDGHPRQRFILLSTRPLRLSEPHSPASLNNSTPRIPARDELPYEIHD